MKRSPTNTEMVRCSLPTRWRVGFLRRDSMAHHCVFAPPIKMCRLKTNAARQNRASSGATRDGLFDQLTPSML